jgi:2-amino-1-hydroxyethylphosphonate dioxygenase (glycine-forming)
VKKINNTIEDIFGLYLEFGNAEYIGEEVSQLEHMTQAAQLAIDEGHDDEVVLAAFFHDIGHICVARTKSNDMAGLGIINHEKIGADFLRAKGFPERVARLVEYHVAAKRYLTYQYPSYFEAMSDASRRTLEFQGGVMSSEEAQAFESDELFFSSIAMRKWDELAKVKDIKVSNFETIKAIAYRVLNKNEGPK